MYLADASCDAEAITGFMQRRFPSTYLKVSFVSYTKQPRALGREERKDYVPNKIHLCNLLCMSIHKCLEVKIKEEVT